MSSTTGAEHLLALPTRHRPIPVRELDPERLRGIAVMFFDCDGVLTDGRVWVDADGTERKAFSVVDGHGVAMLRESGVKVAMLTRSPAGIPNARAGKLNFDVIRTGVMTKVSGLHEVLSELGVEPANAAFMGDDLPDIGPMRAVGLSVTVPTGRPEVMAVADAVTHAPAGSGAVREVCDAIVRSRQRRP